MQASIQHAPAGDSCPSHELPSCHPPPATNVLCLFAPTFHPLRRFAHCQHLGPECVSLSLHLHQGQRAPSPEGTPLRLSRALEQRVADVEGPGDVRHWLQLIGHGEEHEWIDLGTVGAASNGAGYLAAMEQLWRLAWCLGLLCCWRANVMPKC